MLKISVSHLDFIISHIRVTTRHFHDKKLSPTQFFFVGLLERLRHSAFIVKYTIENIYKTPEIEFSCGLAIRAILLDTLITLELLRQILEKGNTPMSQEDINVIIDAYSKEVLSDGLNSTINFFEKSKKYDFLKNEKLENVYNSIAKNYSEFFENHDGDGSKPKVKSNKRINATKLFDKLATNPDTKNLARIYDLYLFYSKYDHFSILYFEAIRTPLPKKLAQLEQSILTFLKHMHTLFTILGQTDINDKFIRDQQLIGNDYILNKIRED